LHREQQQLSRPILYILVSILQQNMPCHDKLLRPLALTFSRTACQQEDPTEEEIDAELLLARNSNNSKRSLQRSFGFRSKKDIAVALPGTGTAAGMQQ
jgi:hypothetical protein